MSTIAIDYTRLSSDDLIAAALERGPRGGLTASARKARVEVERRDTKREAKRQARLAAASWSVVETSTEDTRVTDDQLADLLGQARKVATRLAREAAAEVAEPGDFVRTSIRLRKDFLSVLDEIGATDFLAAYGA